MNKRVFVFGMGDTDHNDDGIGVHVINYLRTNNCIKDAEIIDGKLVQSNLIESFSEVDKLIVIETVKVNSDPGSVQVFEGIEMDALVSKAKNTCLHESGLKYILNITRNHGRLPDHRAIVGIQPENIEVGSKLSDKVAGAIPKVCQRVFEISSNWKI